MHADEVDRQTGALTACVSIMSSDKCYPPCAHAGLLKRAPQIAMAPPLSVRRSRVGQQRQAAAVQPTGR